MGVAASSDDSEVAHREFAMDGNLALVRATMKGARLGGSRSDGSKVDVPLRTKTARTAA